MNIYHTIIIFAVLVSSVSCVDVFITNTQGYQIDIIKNGSVLGSWNYQPSSGKTCRPADTMVEYFDQSRQITIKNNETFPVQVQLSISNQNQAIMNAQLNPIANEMHEIRGGEEQIVNITYNCITNGTKDNEDKWGRVEFSLTVNTPGVMENMQKFSLLKICQYSPPPYDESIIILMGVSIILVAFGTFQVESPIIADYQTPKQQQVRQQTQEETQELSKRHALFFTFGGFPFQIFGMKRVDMFILQNETGSIFLVILFLWYDQLEFVMTILTLISGNQAMIILFKGIQEKLYEKLGITNHEFSIPFLGQMTISLIISVILSLTIVITYAITRNWMLSNLLAASIVLMMFKLMRLPSYKIALLLLGLLFFYDIFWVFYSQHFFGTSVMASVASKVDLPMMIQCPKLSIYPIQTCSLIGLGDLVMPGFFICFCLRFARSLHNNNNYYYTCLGGYILGLVLCAIFLIIFNTGQPALLYLSPCTLIPVAIHACINKEFTQIWNGIPQVQVLGQQTKVSDSVQYMHQFDSLPENNDTNDKSSRHYGL